MKPSGIYSNPKLFWENRLRKNFNITGVGHASLGPEYNSWIYQARVSALESAIASLSISFERKNILEIGCGTGFFTEYFKIRKVKSYTGIDITEISIRSLTEQYPDYHFIQADIGDVDLFINQQFDIIFIADVLYHIVDDTRFEISLKHIGDLLLPSGFLIVSDLFTQYSVDSQQHCKWRSLRIYEECLVKYGLSIVQIKPIFYLLSPPIPSSQSNIIWRIYGGLWRHVIFRLAKWRLFTKTIPKFLSALDRRYFLKHANINTPNSKWLIATRIHAG